MSNEWNFSPEVLAKAQEIGIGNRVTIHWSEAECPDQEGTVIGVEILRHGHVEYAVHIDGDMSPTDGFTHDLSGLEGGTIRLIPDPAKPLTAGTARALVDAKANSVDETLRPSAPRLPDGWQQLLSAHVHKFELACMVDGGSVTWNQDGCRAMASLLRVVGQKLDIALERERAGSGQRPPEDGNEPS